MKSARECKDRFEDMAAFVMGELEPAVARELQDHLAVCGKCREVCDSLMEEEQEIQSGFATLASSLDVLEQTVLDRVRQGHRRAEIYVDSSQKRFFERVKNMILAHKRLSVATAATATALAAGLILHVFMFSSSNVAYALEQTVQANNHITSYHAKLLTPNGVHETWVQLNPDGTPLRARIDYPKTTDGDKVVILSEGKAEVWFKDTKGYTVVPEKNALERILTEQRNCDPKLAFEELQTRKEAGKVVIETKESAKEDGYLTLTVTPKDTSDRREVFEINSNTKLAERVTYYQRQGDQWEQVRLIEYLDYNKEIDPKVFNLDLPKDVVTSNQISRKPGLVKGNLTDEQIATKLAREFFEALIAEDYDKAGLLLGGGVPAEKMKEMFGSYKYLRIVEMEKPKPGPNPDIYAFSVPVKIEMDIKEIKDQKEIIPDMPSPRVKSKDAEKAISAVREFYEALIAEDFDKAGRIAKETGLFKEGFPPEAMKDFMKAAFEDGNIKVSRIVEIGKPVPHPEDGTMEVPIKIELESKFKVGKSIEKFSPFVRPVYGQPDRWNISGGI